MISPGLDEDGELIGGSKISAKQKNNETKKRGKIHIVD
jgi:hypothetical protein